MADVEEIRKRVADCVRADVRLRLGSKGLTDAMLDKPIMLNFGEADQVAHAVMAAVDALGMTIAGVCGCGQPVGVCHDCGEPRCWHCDPGLGKGHTPMSCNRLHAPAPTQDPASEGIAP